jgi:FkbM family methyltransferase
VTLAIARRFLSPPETTRLVQRSIDGCEVLAFANEDVGREIAYLRSYEPIDVGFLRTQIRRDDICLDLGANTGFYTLMMAKHANRGSVHAFEPVPLYRLTVQLAAEINGFTHIKTHDVAIGAIDGFSHFSQSSDGAYSSLRPSGRRSERRSLHVQVRTLDSYLKDGTFPRVDVIKMDVEGAEALVIEGGRTLLSSQQLRPRILMIELFDDNLRPFGTSISDVTSRMHAFGYRPFVASPGGGLEPFTQRHYNTRYNVFFIEALKTLASTRGNSLPHEKL